MDTCVIRNGILIIVMVSNQFSSLLCPFQLNSSKMMYFIEFLKRK